MKCFYIHNYKTQTIINYKHKLKNHGKIQRHYQSYL